jgi:hypothetical protein
LTRVLFLLSVPVLVGAIVGKLVGSGMKVDVAVGNCAVGVKVDVAVRVGGGVYVSEGVTMGLSGILQIQM